MYVSKKKKCLQEDGDTKKLLAAGAAYKKNVCLWIFPNKDTRVMGWHVLTSGTVLSTNKVFMLNLS